ncbi:MAG: hypothetical protein ACR2HH_11820 [Chthoniobacterales bacterium]
MTRAGISFDTRLAISVVSLVLGFGILLVILHGAQPLATVGSALNPASFETVRKCRYLVVIRGAVEQPGTISLRSASGEPISLETALPPPVGEPDAPVWKIVRARARARDVVVFVQGTTRPEIQVRKIDERAPRRKWIATTIFLIGVACFCVFHRRRKWVQAFALGVAYFLFLLPWHKPAFFSATGDNQFYVPTGMSLLERGDWNVDEFGGPTPAVSFKADYSVRQGKDGHYYNLFPPGSTIVALPMIALGSWLTDQIPDPVERARGIAELAAKVISAATIALFYLVLTSLTPRRGLSYILLGVFALATPQLATHGGGLWSHNASTFLSVLALCFWIWKDGKDAALAAVPLALGMACRPTMLLPTAVFASALLLRDRKKFAAFAVLVLAGLGLFVLHSLGMWGELLPPYYTGHATAPGSAASAFLGTLVSPNRGLFVYCPVLLFATVGGVSAWRRGGPLIFRMAGAVVVLEWIVASHNRLWWGGHCYGPRLLCEAVPFGVLLLIPAWETIERLRYRRAFLILGMIASGWGFFVQLQALRSPEVYQWNARPNVDLHPERLWDWSDWQILAAYQKPRPN